MLNSEEQTFPELKHFILINIFVCFPNGLRQATVGNYSFISIEVTSCNLYFIFFQLFKGIGPLAHLFFFLLIVIVDCL